MTPSIIEPYHAQLVALCRQYGVSRLELFGSAAVNRFHEAESDLDFLVEFEHPTHPGYADRYFGFWEALGALFGRPVDLVVASAIKNPYFQESISKTRVVLYAA